MITQQQLLEAGIASCRAAILWLEAEAIQAVGVNCGVTGRWAHLQKDKRHSAPGEPPRRESGEGQQSIFSVDTEAGGLVSVLNIGIPGDMPAGNYMAGHDLGKGVRGGVQRPWLVGAWADYKPQVDAILRREMKSRLGALR